MAMMTKEQANEWLDKFEQMIVEREACLARVRDLDKKIASTREAMHEVMTGTSDWYKP